MNRTIPVCCIYKSFSHILCAKIKNVSIVSEGAFLGGKGDFILGSK